MKYLRKNKTKKIIGGIKQSMPPFNEGNSTERNIKIITEVENKRQQILEFIIDEISKTRKPDGEKYNVKDNKSKDESQTENNESTTSSSQSVDLYKENEVVIKEYLKHVYDRNLMMDFYDLHNHLLVNWVWGKPDLGFNFNSPQEKFEQPDRSNKIDTLQQHKVMEILLFNYLYAKLQKPLLYFFDMYFKIKKQNTFFDEDCKYKIVQYNFSHNPGFFFKNDNDEYFADVAYKMVGESGKEIPKRNVTKITKQGGFMGIGEQVQINKPIYTIEDLKNEFKKAGKSGSISPKEQPKPQQPTTGGKKRRTKRKNKTKKRKNKK